MKRSRYALPMLAGLLVLGGAMFYSFETNPDWQRFDSQAFLRNLRDLDPVWLLLSVLSIYVTYVFRALRWKILVRPMKKDASVWRLLSATVIGFGAIGIMGRAGELVRPYLIARQENLPVSSQLAIWVLERAFDTLILLAIVGFAVGQIDPATVHAGSFLGQWIQAAGHLVGISTALLLIMMVVLRGYYDQLAAKLAARLTFLSPATQSKIAHFLEVFGQGLHSLRDAGSMILCLLISLVQWLCIAGGFFAVMSASPSGPNLSFDQTLILLGVVMAGSIVQIPGIGGGMQITTVLALTEIFAVSVEVASGMALLLWMLTFLVVLPPAILLVAWSGLTWGKLRQLESEA